MITDKTKANAIALLKLGDSAQQISETLEIPFMLVKEWCEELGLEDLIGLEANATALSRVIEGELIPMTEDNVAALKTAIEDAALKIVNSVKIQTLGYADLPEAKALNLLANTCATLYTTIVNKGAADPTGGDTGASMFDHVSKS